MSQILNSFICPIDSQVSLIEASAGTGKTYNIQNLFMRLIMEKDFPIESLLVVTFTDAATRELKSRIRTILTNLNHFFEGRCVPEKERVEQLIADRNVSKNLLASRIEKALRNFDKASIFTIHGFCKKSLEENVFATGSFFNRELQKNTDTVIERITQDFFRKYVYKMNPVEHQVVLYLEFTVKSCLTFLKDLENKSNIIFNSDYSAFDFWPAFEKVKEKLLAAFDKERIINKLTPQIISQAKGQYSPENLDLYLTKTEYFLDDKFDFGSFHYLEKFTASAIRSALKAKKVYPEDEFFQAMDELFLMVSSFKIALYQKLYQYFLHEFQIEKNIEIFHTFNDLIQVLENSLKKNPDLVNNISKNYQAVLIDEFQDTDSLQYSIFHQLFIQKSKPTFLIGDPKQAIYSFRGGDIYAYKSARDYVLSSSGHFYTLPTNYRSTTMMVRALNDFFGDVSRKNKFLSDFIDFRKVDAKIDCRDHLAGQAGPLQKSLHIFYHPDSENNDQRDSFAINRTVFDILKLLSEPDYQIIEAGTSRLISPRDIAILVNTHRQAEALLSPLKNVGIPAVIQTDGSVYDSEEAEAFFRLLKAIYEPGNLKALRGALTSFLFDVTAEELYQMHHENSAEMDRWLLFFRECQRKWMKGSFIEAFNYLMLETNLKPRLLSLENGDRKITNLFHLQELIQQKEIDAALGLSGIVNWYGNQLNPDTREKKDDTELRLETDQEALKIMTIHKSKGLEFPIVFCPFLWSGKIDVSKKLFLEYHNASHQKIIDLEKLETHKAQQEILEEDIRLVYVALTRAKYATYISVPSNKEANALHYFLFRQQEGQNPEILNSLKMSTVIRDFSAYDNIAMTFCSDEPKVEGRYQMRAPGPQKAVQKIQFEGNLSRQWQISSFSSLSKSNLSGPSHDLRDYDEVSRQPETDNSEELNIFTFPAGTKTGNCWHEIFEEISFRDDGEKILEVAKAKLNRFGIVPDSSHRFQDYAYITRQMVENVLQCKISTKEDLQLIDIPREKRLSELEFFFTLGDNVSQKELNTLLKNYNIVFDGPIPKGFMSGFIDLVFCREEKYYILDWKSNAIGPAAEDYILQNIEAEMEKHLYKLQYLVYSVALHRYLQVRLPDYDYGKHFGGVFYLFLRGVKKEIPESGVYFDLPDMSLITALSEVFR
ncbi:MAG: exodeoxyribonuclease V subunit beta [Candidatus Marinimicrobia bacterium]|nr:exodeoxyribonuclease V subunit beta [Candidatus Neomarinimicrobiota bacterium]